MLAELIKTRKQLEDIIESRGRLSHLSSENASRSQETTELLFSNKYCEKDFHPKDGLQERLSWLSAKEQKEVTSKC